jgi:hypothetical protein
MAVRSNSIEHAKHNEQTCNFLSGNKKFCDWAVTTAFYSALHYARHLMIPHTDSDGEKYECFDSFYTATKCLTENKHSFMKNYIRRNHRSISIQYNQLFDLSHSSRYINFNVPRETSNNAKNLLKEIKNYVLTTKPA